MSDSLEERARRHVAQERERQVEARALAREAEAEVAREREELQSAVREYVALVRRLGVPPKPLVITSSSRGFLGLRAPRLKSRELGHYGWVAYERLEPGHERGDPVPALVITTDAHVYFANGAHGRVESLDSINPDFDSNGRLIDVFERDYRRPRGEYSRSPLQGHLAALEKAAIAAVRGERL